MLRALTSLAALLTLNGCVSYNIRSDDTVRTGIGQTADMGHLKVAPLGLLEDSRCPQGVQCVTAGRLRVNVALSTPESKLTREMTLGEPVSIHNGQLTLIEALPSARINPPVYPEQYRFGFRFKP